eukprot:CAMPEP_0198316958 /NCGR_PEP_ID=MMETSP1450-20131203/6636_1 /TAXON_ID=753684 ORGANISM="Madagascaria erythrocladiodes, Strain CCMP3234" /NCGR_SAMPLE_ID=MMETSP1450 /ASSEMBLY_ACC=CAM_ASM_001115 /LENGTH=514 /DNA_ID=CAMNT_0044020137 /DNA_START=64 /DNA_END=1608 /DNA_ORIENTATION=+
MAFVGVGPAVWIGSEPLAHRRARLRSTAGYARRKRVVPLMCAAELGVAERKAQVLSALRAVIDPDLGRDIVTLGFVKNLVVEDAGEGKSTVSYDVELTTPACPVKETFRADCMRLTAALPWVSSVEVTMTAQPPPVEEDDGKEMALSRIGSIIAVASCKGGVGKSTTCVNLAFTMAKTGARVGILDADIYGPSLPTLVRPETELVEFKDGKIQPMICRGLKLMSYGYVNADSAIMRGPMIANLLEQLLYTTDWGELDYLFIDMPPGTGDIQITLSQAAKITAAVIVTTPQRLSFVDVVKGVQMFEKVNVPSVAVVENMAYFTAPESGVKHYIFGEGYADKLQRDFGLQNSFRMPIEPALAQTSDSGVPFVISHEDSESAKTYQTVVDAVVQEVAKIKFGGLKFPEITYNEATGNIDVAIDGEETQMIWPADLRRQCRCAECVDEMTGRQILKPESVPEAVKPIKIAAVGNYAVQIAWDDGHPSLFPYARFVKAWQNTSARREAASDKEVATVSS